MSTYVEGSGSRPRRSRGGRRFAGVDQGTRRRAKNTLISTIKELPNYIRLVYGLLRDGRVARLDKILLGAAVAYVLSPIDLIPDFIPFIGQVDDVFILVTALQHLINNAGRDVVVDHWVGDPADIEELNFQEAIAAAALFLPLRLRRRLRTIGRI